MAKLYLSLFFLIFLTSCHPVIDVTKYHVLPDGSDQKDELQQILQSGNVFHFPAGTYNFNDIVQVSGMNKITFEGEKGTIFKTSKDVIFNLTGNNNEIAFKNIKFVSTKVREDEYSDGFVTNNNIAGSTGTLDGLHFENCEFTKPTANSNGIKINAEGRGKARNIKILNCQFYNIGRAAIETQNHVETDTISRIYNVEIENCKFKDIGTMGTWGLAISISGYSKYVKVSNNSIIDVGTIKKKKNDYYGIENAGASYMEITGNKFTSHKFGYKGILASNKRPKYHCLIQDNTFNLSGPEDTSRIRCIELSNFFNSVIKNNIGNSTGLALQADNVHDCEFSGNKFSCANPITMIFQNGSTRNIIKDNIADGSAASKDFGTILFVDSNTRNNYCFNNTVYKTGKVKGSVGNYNGAENNTSHPPAQ